MLGEVLCFRGTFMAKLITFIRALFNCCTCHGHILCFYFFFFLFMHRSFENRECSCNCFLFRFGTSYSPISTEEKKKTRSKFVIVLVCLSRVLAKVMKLCALSVWLEFIYFWTILLCQCVCRDERSVHKGPVRFTNMKIKHNDNKSGED